MAEILATLLEGRDVLHVETSPLSLGITPERVAGISEAVLRIFNARNIAFSSLCLRVSVINPFFMGSGGHFGSQAVGAAFDGLFHVLGTFEKLVAGHNAGGQEDDGF